MPDVSSLANRIDTEFSAVEEKVKKFQEEQVEAHKQREQRLAQLGKVFDQLRDIWRPRLELLVKQYELARQQTGDQAIRQLPSGRQLLTGIRSLVAVRAKARTMIGTLAKLR